MDAHSTQTTSTLLITVVALFFILRRTLTTQTMRVWALALIPALVVVLAIFVISVTPVSMGGVIAIVIGALLGVVVGYFRGIHSVVKLGPRPGTIVVKGSVVLAIILVAAFAVRFGVRYVFGHDPQMGNAVSDAVIVFAAFSVAVGRGMLFFAYRRLLTNPVNVVSRQL